MGSYGIILDTYRAGLWGEKEYTFSVIAELQLFSYCFRSVIAVLQSFSYYTCLYLPSHEAY